MKTNTCCTCCAEIESDNDLRVWSECASPMPNRGTQGRCLCGQECQAILPCATATRAGSP
eukprot:1517061-Alexandrium_andersonii.AAC.1